MSIRPGWFYRAAEDARVKSASRLFALYEQSVGRNCTLLLNVPPDRRGLIGDPDLKALVGMRERLDRVYGRDLSAGASVTTADRTTMVRLPTPVAFDRVTVLDAHGTPRLSRVTLHRAE